MHETFLSPHSLSLLTKTWMLSMRLLPLHDNLFIIFRDLQWHAVSFEGALLLKINTIAMLLYSNSTTLEY